MYLPSSNLGSVSWTWSTDFFFFVPSKFKSWFCPCTRFTDFNNYFKFFNGYLSFLMNTLKKSFGVALAMREGEVFKWAKGVGSIIGKQWNRQHFFIDCWLNSFWEILKFLRFLFIYFLVCGSVGICEYCMLRYLLRFVVEIWVILCLYIYIWWNFVKTKLLLDPW